VRHTEHAYTAHTFLDTENEADQMFYGAVPVLQESSMLLDHLRKEITKAALPHFPPGVIINTASVQAYEPSEILLDYAQTKSSIVAFTKALTKQLAEREPSQCYRPPRLDRISGDGEQNPNR
jgi:short-subunit dehydrogenase involved in D-alanine esterification of teichoic acids